MELAREIFLGVIPCFGCGRFASPRLDTIIVDLCLINLSKYDTDDMLFCVGGLVGFSIYGGLNLVEEVFKESVDGNQLLHPLVFFLDFEFLEDAIHIP